MYWAGFAVGIPLFLMATWGDLAKTMVMAGVWIGMAVGYAYLLTPYLPIRGRVYALGITPPVRRLPRYREMFVTP